jgi:hypothetical protein
VRLADAGSASGFAVPPGCGPPEKSAETSEIFVDFPRNYPGAPREAGQEKEKIS